MFKRLLCWTWRGFGLSDARLLWCAKAAVLFFFAVWGLLPLPTKPLSDCRTVKQSLIATGNSGFQVPVYSAHAATPQRLVINICLGLCILTLWLTFFFSYFLLLVHSSSSIYRIHIFFPPSSSSSLASPFLSSRQSLFKLSSAPRSCQILSKPNTIKRGL